MFSRQEGPLIYSNWKFCDLLHRINRKILAFFFIAGSVFLELLESWAFKTHLILTFSCLFDFKQFPITVAIALYAE